MTAMQLYAIMQSLVPNQLDQLSLVFLHTFITISAMSHDPLAFLRNCLNVAGPIFRLRSGNYAEITILMRD